MRTEIAYCCEECIMDRNTMGNISTNKPSLNSSIRRLVRTRNIPRRGILAFHRWPQAGCKEGRTGILVLGQTRGWGCEVGRDGIRWIYYCDAPWLRWPTYKLFRVCIGRFIEIEEKRCSVGKFPRKISHATDNAYTAENHERARTRRARHYSAGKFNVNLCFTPAVVVQFRRDGAFKAVCKF